MESKKAKIAIVRYLNSVVRITLFNNIDKVRHHPLYEVLYEDIEIIFNDNGSITLTGNKWEYGITLHDEYPHNLDDVHPECITLTKFRKKQIVRSGWYRKNAKVHESITMNNYRIIEE